MELANATDESALVAALRSGDEHVFACLVDQHTPGLLRVARTHVRDDGAAEEVVQETWLALIHGIDSFEQRSSLQTWLYRVAINRARSRGVKDARTVPLSSFEPVDGGPTVDPARFWPDSDPEWAGHWAHPPRAWQRDPQVQVQSAELMSALRAAIDGLPERQREVIVLRDVQGLSTDEVAETLSLSSGNVRVLLHRGRAKVRAALEEYLG